MDRIEFRHATADLAMHEDVPVVEVVINGRPLSEIWAAATNGNNAMPIPGGDDLWRVDSVPDNLDWDDGRPAVLTCTCGTFGCGGASARIDFEADVVRWSDFHHANDGDRVDIGPFVFSRVQYEAMLARLTH